MVKKVKIRSASLTISGDPYGYGHLKRMIILKSKLKKKKIYNRIIDISRLNINLLKKINLKNYSVLFIDFSNSFFFKTIIFKFLVKELDNHVGKIFIFDSVENEIIKLLIKDKNNRFLICPYFLPKNKKLKARKFNCFYGPNYFLFDKIYLNKNEPYKLKKIFLSCGGLDNQNYTYKIAKQIFLINTDIEIHATIGPMFKKKNINLIKLLKKNNKFYLYNSIKNPSKISQKCDLAIVSSGLTKYEMAASKINLAVFCENSTQAKYNFSFAKSKLSYNLSNFSNIRLMKYKLRYLINNYYKIFNNNSKFKKNLLDNNKFNLILNNAK